MLFKTDSYRQAHELSSFPHPIYQHEIHSYLRKKESQRIIQRKLNRKI